MESRAGGSIPQPHGLIEACRGETFAVGAEVHAGHAGAVAAENMECLTSCGVPDINGFVPISRGETPAVRMKGHATHPDQGLDRINGACVEQRAGGRVPDPHVGAARGESPAIGTVGHAEDPVGMFRECAHELTCGCIPDLYRPVPAAGSEAFTIRTESHASDHIAVAGESVTFLAHGDVPDRHRLII